jgi:hypothetical protein
MVVEMGRNMLQFEVEQTFDVPYYNYNVGRMEQGETQKETETEFKTEFNDGSRINPDKEHYALPEGTKIKFYFRFEQDGIFEATVLKDGIIPLDDIVLQKIIDGYKKYGDKLFNNNETIASVSIDPAFCSSKYVGKFKVNYNLKNIFNYEESLADVKQYRVDISQVAKNIKLDSLQAPLDANKDYLTQFQMDAAKETEITPNSVWQRYVLQSYIYHLRDVYIAAIVQTIHSLGEEYPRFLIHGTIRDSSDAGFEILGGIAPIPATAKTATTYGKMMKGEQLIIVDREGLAQSPYTRYDDKNFYSESLYFIREFPAKSVAGYPITVYVFGHNPIPDRKAHITKITNFEKTNVAITNAAKDIINKIRETEVTPKK